MARTYSNTPVLSKIKLGANTYWLRDADARAILDAISADVYESLKLALVSDIADGGNNLATAGTIKAYVDRIAEIGFDVVVLNSLPTADATAYETYHNNIVLIADGTSTTGAYVEYVILRSGTEGSYTYAWERIGTTQVDLNGYLKDVSYVDATHTLQQTKNVNGVDTTTNVHVFGGLADANTASNTYTPAGNITVNELTQTNTTAKLTKGNYTPAGNITVNTLNQTNTEATLTKGDYTPVGTISTVNGIVTNRGTLPTLGDPTKSAFATEGVTVGLDSTDTECLVFTTAQTAQAVTDQGTFSQGELPTLGTDTPTFTGTEAKDILVTKVEYDKATQNGATFAGTEAADVLVTKVEYDKATQAGATFAGTQATITVNPDARNNNNNNNGE